MMINGRELSEPELRAYIKELEAFKSRALKLLSEVLELLGQPESK